MKGLKMKKNNGFIIIFNRMELKNVIMYTSLWMGEGDLHDKLNKYKIDETTREFINIISIFYNMTNNAFFKKMIHI